jgi:hypothetical protein
MPLTSSKEEREQLILEINNNCHIKKAVFVYDINKKFLGKYEGVMEVERLLKISHSTIKKHANVAGVYKGYIFNYERLND